MWLLVLFLLASPVIVGVGVREAVRQRRLRREGINAEGQVVRHDITRGMGGASYAVVAFVDAQGGSHQFKSAASGVRGLPVGGPAPVVYLPGAPGTAQLDLVQQRFLSVALPFFVGAAFMAGGIWALATGL